MAVRWRDAWIVGGSTGIGAEVARALAADDIPVVVSARSADRLAALAGENDRIAALALDVVDRAACESTVADMTRVPDLVILNAAVYEPMYLDTFDAEKAAWMMRVNYEGIVNVLAPLARRLADERRGHIAIVASPSGYRGLPGAAGYGPTKAALINLAESLHNELAQAGVRLSIVNPGFVRTRLTDRNDFSMPQLLEPEDAARRIIAGLKAGKWDVAFPWPFVGALKFLSILPGRVYFAITKKLIRPQD